LKTNLLTDKKEEELMPWKRQVKVLHARDGEHIYQELCNAFADFPEIEVNNDPDEIPKTHDIAVGVFILTDEVKKDVHLSPKLEQLFENHFPVLPLVENIGTYDFSSLPPSLERLWKINAVGWDEGSREGEKAFVTIKQYLGLIPFKDQLKVFISYSRSDKDVAVEVHNFLHGRNYWTFLDTEDIAGGRVVQPTIMKAISDRDLILLIDSPGAAKSKWVEKEIARALSLRVTVCGLRLSEKQYFPLFREMPGILWDKKDPDRFKSLESFIDGIIASKGTFDLLIERNVREIEKLVQCDIRRVQKRKLRLSKQVNSDQKNLLIEYEDAPPSLDRLYRLHTSYKRSSNLNNAIFIHNGLPLSKLEQDAVDWAKGDEPLQMLALTEIIATAKLTLEA
jgi:hypothetical protein